MPRYTEDDILQALNDITNSKSILEVICTLGVLYSILQGQIKGSRTYYIAVESQQRLSKVQGDYLTQQILTQEALGLPSTHAQIKSLLNESQALKETPKYLVNAGYKSFLDKIRFLGLKELMSPLHRTSGDLDCQLECLQN